MHLEDTRLFQFAFFAINLYSYHGNTVQDIKIHIKSKMADLAELMVVILKVDKNNICFEFCDKVKLTPKGTLTDIVLQYNTQMNSQ